MEVKLKYFGMIAQKLAKSDELVNVVDGIELTELNDQLRQQYPSLSTMNYQLALNQQLVTNAQLQSNDEVALLPPFAGG